MFVAPVRPNDGERDAIRLQPELTTREALRDDGLEVLDEDGVRATATVSLTGRTGVEMEALTATSVALLTIYDMAKALDKTMTIGDVRLQKKTGGKSGDFTAA